MKKTLAIGTLALAAICISACGGSTKKSSTGGTESEEFKAVKATLLASCAQSGCHDGTQTPTLETETQYKANAEDIKVQVAGDPAAMPKDDGAVDDPWGGATTDEQDAAKDYLLGL